MYFRLGVRLPLWVLGSNMVIMQLTGGLGNQLFQYALGRKLALSRDNHLRFDLRTFQHQQRQYMLGAEE